MIELSPQWVGGALALLGALVGFLAGFLMFRRSTAALGERLGVAQTLAEQHAESAAALRGELSDARYRLEELDHEKDEIDRELAASQSSVAALRERLEEARSALRLKEQALDSVNERLVLASNEVARLNATQAEKLAHIDDLKRSFEHSREQLKVEFQSVASQILEEKGKTFAQNSQVSLDALLKPFREQIDGFQQRVNHVHDEAIRGHASLGMQIRQVLEIGVRMTDEANNLALALKGQKKTTGNWGEIQLEKTLQLAGLVKGDHYDTQARFKDEQGNVRLPDFVVKLPDGKHMVIDSKVSLVDYDRAISAQEDVDQQAALDAHVKAVRNHIDDLSRKDYSNLIGMRSPSFVLMFMPIEPAYIEALKHNRNLFNYGYDRNVVMVSHTTLMPILKTVANLWMVARSNEQAHELSARAGEIYNQVVVVAENLKKLGDCLGTASNYYNKTVTSLAGKQGLYGKAARFNELSAKANKTMPALDPLHRDIESEKLELVIAGAPQPPSPPEPQ